MNISDTIVAIFATITTKQVAPQSALRDILSDSLEYMDILGEIRNQCGVSIIDEHVLWDFVTVQDVIDEVETRIR